MTAQKREERLIDVPASIVAVTATALQRQNAINLADYVAQVPGLTLNSQPGGISQLSIRGISTGTGGNPTVAMYVDDAPVGASISQAAGGSLAPDIDPNDIQRIEVLRGPQGTLYGADNLGGVIRFVLVSPSVHELEARTWVGTEHVQNGDFGYAARARVSFPLIDGKLGFLVSGFTREDPAFIDDAGLGKSGVNEARVAGGRLALLWSVSDTLSVKLSAILNNRRADGVSQEDVDPQTLDPVFGDLQQRRAASTGTTEDILRLYAATVDWNVGWGTLTSTTSYGTLYHTDRLDLTGSFQAAFQPLYGTLGYAEADNIRQRKLSEEIRLGSRPGATLDWTLGGYFTREQSDVGLGVPTFDPVTGEAVPIPDVILDALTPSEFKEYAAFGEVTYHFTPRFSLTGGVRLSHNKQTIVQRFSGLLTGPVDTTSISDDSSTTFLISPQFKLSDRMNVYARAASGYRPGGPNYPTSPPTPLTYEPDHDIDYEIGLKAALPDRMLSFDIDVFYMDWRNIQLNVVTPSGLQYTANAGSASSRGVELSLAYRPIQALDLSLALSHTDAVLEKGLPSGGVGAKGDPLPYDPKFKANLSADYTFGAMRGWLPFLGATYAFNGAERSDFVQSSAFTRIVLPQYQTIDARLGLRNDTWTVELYAKNIADRRGFESTSALNGPTGPYGMTVIQPRTVGLSLIANF